MNSGLLIPLLIGTGILLAVTTTGQGKSNALIPKGDLFIDDNDTVWDYKRESGVWWTKRKENAIWLNMKSNLSIENYKIAIQILEFYLQKKYRNIEIVNP